MLTSIAALLLPLALGAVAARLSSLGPPDSDARAVDVLNRYALVFAFPALVTASVADPALPAPTSPVLFAIPPLALLPALALARAIARGPLAGEAGTMALVAAFGNTAYLGLPVVIAVLGEEATGTAALVLSVHVALAMTVGPICLARWSEPGGAAPSGSELGAVLKMLTHPLVLSPLVGLALRALPAEELALVRGALVPFGRTAGPTGLFALGVHLWNARRELAHRPGSAVAHTLVRLVAVPLATVALCAWARAEGLISSRESGVLVLLAAPPAAVATFAIAQQRSDAGGHRVARAIVASTLASALTLPIAAWWALRD